MTACTSANGMLVVCRSSPGRSAFWRGSTQPAGFNLQPLRDPCKSEREGSRWRCHQARVYIGRARSSTTSAMVRVPHQPCCYTTRLAQQRDALQLARILPAPSYTPATRTASRAWCCNRRLQYVHFLVLFDPHKTSQVHEYI